MKRVHFRLTLRIATLIAFVVGISTTYLAGWQPAFASAMTKTSVVEYNMVTSGVGNVAIDFSTVAAGATSVNVSFGAWGGSLQTTNLSATSNATCTSMFAINSAATMTTSAPSVTSQTFTFTVTALSATTNYCAILSSTTGGGLATNPSSGNVYGVVITAGSDSQTDYIDVISNDQYSITGTVPSGFTMSLSGATDTFTGNLSSTTYTTTTGITVAINTNALTGWMLWAADLNTGLHSSSTTQTIASVATGSLFALNGAAINTNAYALGVTSVTNGSATANYTDTTGYSGGGLTPATTGFNEIASYGSQSSTTDNIVVKEIADTSAATKAGSDYADTITLVGAGSF